MDTIAQHVAILPRTSVQFYSTLPRNLFSTLLGLFMCVSGTIFSSGGCTTSNNNSINVPLSRFLSTFGTLYLSLHLLLIAMGVMMLSHVEHIESTKKKEIYDIHILDVIYLVITIPTGAFLLCFFLLGNTWFFSINGSDTFVGANALACQQSLDVGYTCILIIWISIPACAVYIAAKNKINENHRQQSSRKTKSKTKNNREANSSDTSSEKDSFLEETVQLQP